MKEISAVDYVDEVNKAGDGVWVVLHLYKTGYPPLGSEVGSFYPGNVCGGGEASLFFQ